MSTINYDDWGWYYPGDLASTLGVYYDVPAQPACPQWTDSTEGDCMIKMRCRAYYETDDVDAYRVILDCNNDGSMTEHSPVGANPSPGWDAGVSEAAEPIAPQTNPDSIDDYGPEFAVPYFKGNVIFAAGYGMGATSAVVYGVEILTQYDKDYDGDYLELFDYTDSLAYGTDRSGSSFVMNTLGAHGMNRLNYCATFRIGCAVADNGRV